MRLSKGCGWRQVPPVRQAAALVTGAQHSASAAQGSPLRKVPRSQTKGFSLEQQTMAWLYSDAGAHSHPLQPSDSQHYPNKLPKSPACMAAAFTLVHASAPVW